MDRDLRLGFQGENKVLKYLQDNINSEIKKIDEIFHQYDFTDGSTLYELKTRRCNHNKYPDTMIGRNKVQYAYDNPNKKFVFLFKFNDGLYRHDFNPELNYICREGGRRDRGKDEIKPYIFIPINHLSFVCNL